MKTMNHLRDMSDLQLEDVEDYTAEYPTVEEDIRSTAESDVNKSRRGVVSAFCLENKKVIFVSSVVFLVVFGIALIATSSSTTVVPSPLSAHQPLIIVDPNSLDPAISGPLNKNLKDVYTRHGLDKSTLNDDAGDDTPQRRAFYWLSSEFNEQQIDHGTRMTRYALAVFYYSTNGVAHKYEENPKTWMNANLWLSQSHVCEWQGIVCNEKMHVSSIELERNYLTGSFPKEMILLSDKLDTIDLTSNMIYMKGDHFDAFASLKNVHTLLMDDNFLEYKQGLPTQMAGLTNLKKLRLSYNLFEGPLEKGEIPVLAAMTKLTHLEIESNFLTGDIPDQIGLMSNLVYLYLRRNSMEFNLDFLKGGKLDKLFALWLDANKITGTIPTQVGKLTNLASLSVTNATLVGTIPTEMANMESMRRLWLYGNSLTGEIPSEFKNLNELEVLELHHNKLQGEMPGGVCQVIQAAEYEFKSLTSDCKESVECSTSCCTKCY